MFFYIIQFSTEPLQSFPRISKIVNQKYPFSLLKTHHSSLLSKNISRHNSQLGIECKINVKCVWKNEKRVRIFAIPIRKTSSIVVDIVKR